jgi:nitric oxide reductase subunit C
MLSKSAARAFFVIGTGVCSLAFLGLTVDTFAKIPAQTHESAISPAVVRGKELWEAKNCMGCHTLFGEGGYYAPELTRVMERRGADFVRAMLRDPEAMYPGQRKMQNYKLREEQMDDLIAFLDWAGKVDLQGFPPRPSLVPMAVPATNASQGLARTDDRPKVFNQLCVACHALGGQGGSVGPALDNVGDRRDAEYIKRWLRDPAAVKADSKMPKLPVTEEQVQELSAFLSHQTTGKAPGGDAGAGEKEKSP